MTGTTEKSSASLQVLVVRTRQPRDFSGLAASQQQNRSIEGPPRNKIHTSGVKDDHENIPL